MSSSTTKLTGGIRARLRDFDPTVGSSLGTTVTGGIHYLAPPDPVSYPYCYFRLISARTGNLDDSRLEEEGEIEVTFVGRHRQQLATIMEALDVAEQAFLNWSTDQLGWLSVRRLVTRMTLPQFPAPAAAEIVQTRGVWRYTWWPDYRMQYAVEAGASAP